MRTEGYEEEERGEEREAPTLNCILMPATDFPHRSKPRSMYVVKRIATLQLAVFWWSVVERWNRVWQKVERRVECLDRCTCLSCSAKYAIVSEPYLLRTQAKREQSNARHELLTTL